MIRSGTINKTKIIILLVCSWLVLWSASVIQDISIWVTGTNNKIWVLDLDFEESLYTWFSTILLSFAALVSLFVGSIKKEGSEKFKRHWMIIGFLFFMLSIDEMLSFHERVSGMLSNAFPTSGIFEFAWVIPAIFIISFLGLFFWPFIRQLPASVSRTIIIAGAIFVFGAVGMEMVAGLFISENSLNDDAFTSPIYRILANIEEGLEVVGVIVFIKALLTQAELYCPVLFQMKEASVRKSIA